VGTYGSKSHQRENIAIQKIPMYSEGSSFNSRTRNEVRPPAQLIFAFWPRCMTYLRLNIPSFFTVSPPRALAGAFEIPGHHIHQSQS